MKKYWCFFIAIWFVTTHLFCNIDQLAQEAATQGYHQEFIGLVEMIYGKGFLSQGGEDSIDQMFEGVDLDGCALLDIGSGLGLPLIYTAKNYEVRAVGIEAQKWMVERANRNLQNASEELKGTVDFLNANNLRQFSDQTFDVVMSKEALLHIPLEIKEQFFKEICRVLKPGSQIVILDWMHSRPNYTSKTKRMMEIDEVAYNLISPAEYEEVLSKVGFSDVRINDITSQYAKLSEESKNKIISLKSAIQSIPNGIQKSDFRRRQSTAIRRS